MRVNFVVNVADHIFDLEYACVESPKGQEKIQKGMEGCYCNNDSGIEGYLANFSSLFINVLGLLLYAIVAGRQSFLILLVLIGSTLPVCLLNLYGEGYERKHRQEQRKELIKFQYLCDASMDVKNSKDIRLYKIKEWFLNAFSNTENKIIDYTRSFVNHYYIAKGCDKILGLIRNAVVYGYFIYLMQQGKITISQLILFVGIASGFSKWINDIFFDWSEIIRNGIIMDGCWDFFDYGVKEEAADVSKVNNKGIAHEIRFEHVSYCYPGKEEAAIHDLTLTIHPKEKIALVGVNGAGKSTLIKLMCGLYRPTSGKIYLDGCDISGIALKDYYEEFSVVFQDVFSFSFSVGENVSCMEKDKQDEGAINTSLKKSDLYARVMSFSNGSSTMLGKDVSSDGVELSGGELQKLMLARALYKNAPIVILDEPTAALDPIAESDMYEKYHSLTKNKTSVFISHRLSSTKFCDRILFMENGRITEEGTHRELLRANRGYAKMFRVQAHYYNDVSESEVAYDA
ncbi:ABC transporter, ATP-binding protein [Lachnospiraceae bacterium KM106-2]|nr:ABC transporter, ATP-binding protein [Lachnospiraceae bacterium KM106-2]